MELPADEGEPLAQFEQEPFQLVKEVGLQFPLVERLLQSKEVEDVGVFERLLNEVGLRRGQEPLEVGDRLSLPAVGLGLDHRSRTLRLQPLASVCCIYQKRWATSLTFSISMTW